MRSKKNNIILKNSTKDFDRIYRVKGKEYFYEEEGYILDDLEEENPDDYAAYQEYRQKYG